MSTELGEAHGPVGYDEHSYAYRDVSGCRVHQSIRSPYARPYGVGDVVGVLVDFETPPAELELAERTDGGASAGPADHERQARAAAASAAGASRAELEALLYNSSPPVRGPAAAEGAGGGASAGGSGGAAPPGGANAKHSVQKRWWGSSVRFFVNGVDQGIAFVHLTRETRIHAAASVYGGGAVRLNAGPVFSFPPHAERFPPKDPIVFTSTIAPTALPVAAAAAAPAASLSSSSPKKPLAAAAAASSPAAAPAAAAQPSSPPAPPASLVPAACSPWRPLSECTEAPAHGGGPRILAVDGTALVSDPSASVTSSSLAGTGLLRSVTAGRGYNFAGTAFAYKAEQPLSMAPEKKPRRR